MAKFSVSLWIEIEAGSYDEAYQKSDEIEKQIISYIPSALDVGNIDVECQGDDELEDSGVEGYSHEGYDDSVGVC